MARWIEVPATRILVVSSDEFHREYKRVDINGNLPAEAMATYRIIRIKDSVVFRWAQFLPNDFAITGYYYLERI